MIDLFLAHDNPAFCASLKEALEEVPDLRLVSETTIWADALEAISSNVSNRPRMLVVRYALNGPTSFDSFANAVRLQAPDVYVVPILEGNESGGDWQKFLTLEMRDFLIGPSQSPSEVARLLRWASRNAQAHYENFSGQYTKLSYVISVVSARGVQGKTVIATNLAAAMATWTDGVLLLDFSLHPMDFPVFLDDVSVKNITDAVSSGAGLLESLLPRHPRLGFNYLASPDEKDLQAFDYDQAALLLDKTGRLVDFTIIDTGEPKAGPTIAAVDQSDLIFVVTTRDVVRLLATRDYLKFLKSERQIANSKIKLLLNEPEFGAEISEAEIESLLEHPIAAYIPSNRQSVTFSINTGAPIVISEPSQPVSAVLSKLAQLCYKHWNDSGDGPPGPRRGPNDPSKGDGPGMGGLVPLRGPTPILSSGAMPLIRVK